jgi:hypothetical protein
MSDEKVISLISRRPLIEEQKEAADIAAAVDSSMTKSASENQEMIVEALEGMIARAKEGRVEGLMMMARDPLSGLFYQSMIIGWPAVPREQWFSYLGAMESLRMELVDMTQMAPTMLPDGSTLDPWENADVEEFE